MCCRVCCSVLQYSRKRPIAHISAVERDEADSNTTHCNTLQHTATHTATPTATHRWEWNTSSKPAGASRARIKHVTRAPITHIPPIPPCTSSIRNSCSNTRRRRPGRGRRRRRRRRRRRWNRRWADAKQVCMPLYAHSNHRVHVFAYALWRRCSERGFWDSAIFLRLLSV